MTMSKEKSSAIHSILWCRICEKSFALPSGVCGCGKALPVRNGKINFLPEGTALKELQEDWLNRVKHLVKERYAFLYPKLIALLSPVYGPDPVPKFLSGFSDTQVILNLGSGTSDFTSENVVNADMAAYDNVDVVMDLTSSPFRPGSVDGIINIAVLEYVPDPQKIVAVFLSLLKPGGRILVFVPFMQGFHASPHDYQRYTHEGLKILFKEFSNIKIVAEGPTSSLLWILQEWLAMVLSLGNVRLYRLLSVALWILSPLKYLDIFMRNHPCAENIASGFFVFAEKKN